MIIRPEDKAQWHGVPILSTYILNFNNFFSARYPQMGYKTWALHDQIYRVLFHYIPALLVDALLTLMRKKRFMMNTSLKVST